MNCLICFDKDKNVYKCNECEVYICGECILRLVKDTDKCPHCRQTTKFIDKDSPNLLEFSLEKIEAFSPKSKEISIMGYLFKIKVYYCETYDCWLMSYPQNVTEDEDEYINWKFGYISHKNIRGIKEPNIEELEMNYWADSHVNTELIDGFGIKRSYYKKQLNIHIMSNIPTWNVTVVLDKTELSCINCNKKYKSPKNLYNHYILKHSEEPDNDSD